MTPLNDPGDDDQFTRLLAQYNEVLSERGSLDVPLDPALSPELRRRLQRSLDCLRRLKQYRPCLPAGDTVTLVLNEGITLHGDLAGGQVGRFQIVRTLGQGGGGIVFLAFDPDLQRQVALKIPHLTTLLKPEMRRRFLREARAAARLNHPNLVPVHEVGETNGTCYLVSSYCTGGNLAEWLKQRTTPVPVGQAAEFLAALAEAVQYVHEHGIYHRDIKPGNILLDPRFNPPSDEQAFVPRLTDFGLAKLHDAQSEATRSGTLLGTASYMAPEQVEGRLRDIGPATDVYGLGAVLYEVLAGRPAFRGVTDADTLRQVLIDDAPPLRRLRREVPPDLETICLKCLEKNPSRRYASAAELAGDLRRFLNHQPILARPLGRTERLLKWVHHHPAHTIFFTSALLIAFVLLTGWHWLTGLHREHDALREASTKENEEKKHLIRQKEVHLAQLRYTEDIAQAWHFWEARRPEGMINLLDKYRPSPGVDGPDTLRGFEWRFLSRLAYGGSLVMRYPSGVYAVAFSPDGSTCASGHQDGTIVLWDTSSGRQRAIRKDHRFTVYHLWYSPDGKILASLGSDSREMSGPRSELLLWDTEKNELISKFPVPPGDVSSLAFSPDGRILAVAVHLARGGEEVQLWEMPAGVSRGRISFAATRTVVSVAFSSDGKTIAVGHGDGAISLCDAETGKILDTQFGHADAVLSLASGHKEAVLASSGHNGQIRICSLSAGGEFRGEYRHESSVWSLALSPDDRTLASVSLGMLKVWDCEKRREHFSRALPKVGRVVAFSPNGETLALGCGGGRLWLHHLSRSADGRLSMTDVPQSAETHSWLGHRAYTVPREAWAVAFSPDGKRLASAGDDCAIRFWNPVDGSEQAVLRGHQSLVSCIAFSPDGTLLASGSFDPQGNLKLWNTATGEEVATLPGHSKPIYALAFAPNGKILATAGRDRITRLWNVEARSDQPILSGHEIESLAFSPDGRTLALASQTKDLFLWDMEEKTIRRIQPPHPVQRAVLAFSPDSKTLATGDSEGTMRFFDCATGEERLRVRKHTGAVNCLAFSPDGKTLATASFDKTVKLWQATTGRELLTLPEQKDRVRWLAFSPDGTMLATACHDGVLKIYRADSDYEAPPPR
jgi:WD40 repeat protein/serine/threonine protein kinase